MGYRVFFYQIEDFGTGTIKYINNVLRFSNAWKTLANLPYA